MTAVRKKERVGVNRFIAGGCKPVAATGVPPAAGTRDRVDGCRAVNKMTSSRFQAPGAVNADSATVTTGPPAASIRLRRPSATKATVRLSGDQNGASASSVPANACAAGPSSGRIQSILRWLGSGAIIASRRPFGDSEKCGDSETDNSPGGKIVLWKTAFWSAGPRR